MIEDYIYIFLYYIVVSIFSYDLAAPYPLPPLLICSPSAAPRSTKLRKNISRIRSFLWGRSSSAPPPRSQSAPSPLPSIIGRSRSPFAPHSALLPFPYPLPIRSPFYCPKVTILNSTPFRSPAPHPLLFRSLPLPKIT